MIFLENRIEKWPETLPQNIKSGTNTLKKEGFMKLVQKINT